MRRRALLSLVGVAAAGCLGDDPRSRSASPSARSPTGERPRSTTATTPPTRTSDGTDARLAEPLDVGVPAAESDCPSDGDVDRTVCVPETEPGSVPIALTGRPASGTVSLPASLRFELVNHTGGTFQTNPYDWRLWKRLDGRWHVVAPDFVLDPLLLLAPGDRHRWTLGLERSLPDTSGLGGTSPWDSSGSVAAIGGGEYAFTTRGWFETDAGTQSLGFGVRFAVDAPQTTLEPTDAVTDVTRDGDVVIVRGESIPESGPPVRTTTFVVRRDDGEAEARRLLPEVAARDRQFRNTLPYAEDGVREVRYVERNRGIDAPVSRPSRFVYDDDRFETDVRESATETDGR